MPEYDPVTKISIVPRGAAGGLTFFAPSDERLDSGLYRCGPCWCLLACSPFICTRSLYGMHVAMDLDRVSRCSAASPKLAGQLWGTHATQGHAAGCFCLQHAGTICGVSSRSELTCCM